MPALALNFDASVTTQQRQWFNDALGHSTFAWGQSSLNVQVKTVAEPSCAGHKDYMCTSVTDGVATVEIREGADDPTRDFNQGIPNVATNLKRFFEESVIHEMGHAFFMSHFDETFQLTISGYFVRDSSTGDGTRQGTENDWNPLNAAWGDRIQEALAEFFKDVYMPSSYRVFDNRSNWRFNSASFTDWIQLIESVICPPSDPVTTNIAGQVTRSGYPSNIGDSGLVVEGLKQGSVDPSTEVPYSDTSNDHYGGGFTEASGTLIHHPGDFNTPVDVGAPITVEWDFIGDGLDDISNAQWDYYKNGLPDNNIPADWAHYTRDFGHYPVTWQWNRITSGDAQNGTGYTERPGWAPFPEGPRAPDGAIVTNVEPIGGIYFYVRYRNPGDSADEWTYVVAGDIRRLDLAKGSAAIPMQDVLEIEWRLMLPTDANVGSNGSPNFNDPTARGGNTRITARPVPVSCPAPPPWPYPSPKVNASQGPYGIMRGAHL